MGFRVRLVFLGLTVWEVLFSRTEEMVEHGCGMAFLDLLTFMVSVNDNSAYEHCKNQCLGI